MYNVDYTKEVALDKNEPRKPSFGPRIAATILLILALALGWFVLRSPSSIAAPSVTASPAAASR
jgi:hypothetical protein